MQDALPKATPTQLAHVDSFLPRNELGRYVTRREERARCSAYLPPGLWEAVAATRNEGIPIHLWLDAIVRAFLDTRGKGLIERAYVGLPGEVRAKGSAAPEVAVKIVYLRPATKAAALEACDEDGITISWLIRTAMTWHLRGSTGQSYGTDHYLGAPSSLADLLRRGEARLTEGAVPGIEVSGDRPGKQHREGGTISA